MKKILLTATVLSHIAQFHKPLIRLLQENGYEVHVAAKNNLNQKNGLSLNEPDKIYDIPFERSPIKINNLRAYRKISEIIEENKYDIVHCNTPVGGVITRLAANKHRKRGLKVYYTAHGFHFYKGAPLKNWMIFFPIEKIMAKFSDVLLTITKEDYLLAKKKFDTDIRHVHGVGVDSNRYYPVNNETKKKLRQSMGYNEKEFIILCTGELNENKNQKTIIHAVSEIIKKNNNVKLLLAGNGPLNDNLYRLSKNLKIEDYVVFLGYRTDLEKIVQLSDLVVSVSRREGLPLNIIEAMLSKKPVIASHNRGHDELINNGLNGHLIYYRDAKGLSERVLEYMETSASKSIIAQNGYDSIWNYELKNVLEEMKEIYSLN